MSRTHPPARRRLGPRIEPLEARALLTAPQNARIPRGSPILGAPVLRGSMMGDGGAMMGQPTPHEQARRSFVAAFFGPYLIGPGRTTDQSSQIYLHGGGTSSMFLHGDFEMETFVPSDPAGTVTGRVYIYDKNFQSMGTVLVLDLQGDRSPVDGGRPTVLNWQVGMGSAGSFANADGQGSVTIRYIPGHGRLPRRAVEAGRASVVFHGSLDVDPAANPRRALMP